MAPVGHFFDVTGSNIGNLGRLTDGKESKVRIV